MHVGWDQTKGRFEKVGGEGGMKPAWVRRPADLGGFHRLHKLRVGANASAPIRAAAS